MEVDGFLTKPTPEALDGAKRVVLLEIAQKLKLQVSTKMRKAQVQTLIAECYVSEEVLDGDVLEMFAESKPIGAELQLPLEKLKREAEDKQSQHELRLKQFEAEEVDKQREEAERQRWFEVQGWLQGGSVPDLGDRFSASREVKLVPPFDEAEVDKSFLQFEKVAQNRRWPKDSWAVMLQSVIQGRAQQAYSALTLEEAADYDSVKEAVLKPYQLVPEAYRQKFRDLGKSGNQTYVEFANEKFVYFSRWCTSDGVNGDVSNLKELVLIEEFKRCDPDEMKTYLDEKDVAILQEAARLADELVLTHKVKFTSGESFQESNWDDQGKIEVEAGTSDESLEEEAVPVAWVQVVEASVNPQDAEHCVETQLKPEMSDLVGKEFSPFVKSGLVSGSLTLLRQQ
ncbi:uncharacterized protein LOC134341476 isoform X1 [Mobula hypostoma]|uniref:uncharacterized protein LOC134341476 isoform X1 n=1 Tax=Mobula hypostoma TaxID=723540 RepID=UPI002FC3D4F7